MTAQATEAWPRADATVALAFDAGFQSALDFVSNAPTSCGFTADAARRALDVRRARLAADERMRRLDAAEAAGITEYDRERAAQGLVQYRREAAA